MKIQNKPVEMFFKNISTKTAKSAFTLVELIIVITILAILATIGFISFQSYTLDARDSNRITSIKEMSSGLEIYYTKKATLPDPDAQVTTISSGTSIISYQGYAGTSVQQAIRSTEMKDPKDNLFYTYTISGDKTKYQLLALLENGTTVNTTSYNNLVNTTYAANSYTGRYMYTVGNKVGVFVDNLTKAPVQETLTGIDLRTNTNTFKVVFANTTSNSGVIVGSGINLASQIQTISNTVAVAQTTSVATSLKVQDVFATNIYTGNGTTQTINNGIDLLNNGGLIWFKNRTASPSLNPYHQFRDTVRGLNNNLSSNITNGNVDYTGYGPTNLTSTGFDMTGNSVISNTAGYNYVSWTFRKAPKFFDVVTWTGNGVSGRQIPHNLGISPGMIIMKRTDTTSNWVVTHRGDGITAQVGGYLNSTAGLFSDTNESLYFNSSYFIPTNMDGSFNTNGGTYVAYLFANDDSADGIIKCGILTGNSATPGPIVNLGWEPQYLLLKNISGTAGSWIILDSSRGFGVSGGPYIYADSSAAEYATGPYWTSNSTGFQLNGATTVNQNGVNTIYCAIRKGPM